ncbi:MAG: methyltransferase domain-containing protein [Alphaproteobacteria bacterium]|nr:methyltransferase domain-containing protein [Alphaproteobacteria bacterium]
MSIFGRALFSAGQASRAVWFGAQYSIAQKLAPPLDGPVPAPGSIPGWPYILKDLRRLQQRDWSNVEAGYYPPPADLLVPPGKMLRNAARFLRDVPAVNLRRRLKANSETFNEQYRGRRPRYYLQNFHYQSGGWMTEDSAALYDHQVEVLFTGGADAMRRQALVPIGDWIRANGIENKRLLDVACGTARFLFDVKRAHPGLSVVGLDLSEAYLARACRNLRRWRGDFRPILSKAEAMPLRDREGADLITAIFLFHELPAKVRRSVLREVARVLRPGGRFVLVDSIQIGDHPAYDRLLDRFPLAFHEPYYKDYIRDDLVTAAAEAGLVHRSTARAFFARVMTFDRPK